VKVTHWVVRTEPSQETGERARVRIDFPAQRETAWQHFWERFDHTERARLGAERHQLEADPVDTEGPESE